MTIDFSKLNELTNIEDAQKYFLWLLRNNIIEDEEYAEWKKYFSYLSACYLSIKEESKLIKFRSKRRLTRSRSTNILRFTGNQTRSGTSERRLAMGLYKRGLVWWMDFVYQGKQVRRSTETGDRKLAQRIFNKVNGEIAEGKWFEHLEREDRTFRELVEKYLSEYSAPHKKPSSHLRDKCITAHLMGSFADAPLTEITTKSISDYKVKRRGEGVSPRTINYELTVMSHAFNLAIREWEWLKDNPVQRVAKEKVRNQIERWLTANEEKDLLKVSPKWLQDIILFAIHTGLRQGEILDLKWSQVDLERKTIFIAEQKNQGVDTLPINETVKKILMGKSNTGQSPNDHVFSSMNNTRMNNRNLIRAFHTAADKAEIKKIRFHDLRHTFATRLVQAGVDIYKVQKLGRWKTVSMVQRYAHHYTESLRSGVEVMDGEKSSTILAQSTKKEGYKPKLRLVTH